MTRCVSFYEKVERDGTDWCEKCPEAVRLIENYLDLKNELKEQGIPEETTMVGLSERAARPLFSIQDETIKGNVMSSVKNALESGKNPITGRFTNKPLDSKTVEQVIEKATNVHFSSDTDEWYTPSEIIDSVVGTLESIDTDPCSNGYTVPAKTHYKKEDDGLSRSWSGKVYMNPPYGNVIGEWVQKALYEYLEGEATEIIILVPARTDTAWFQSLVDYPWCAVKGRLKFSDSKNSAPFPSAIFYLGENVKGFFENFEQFGTIFRKVDWMEANVS